MEAAVDGELGQVQADDAVERSDCFGAELIKHASGDPLVTTGSQCGVRDVVFEDRFDVDPRRPGGEPDQEPPEAEPVGHSRAVTSERMQRRFGQQRFDGGEHGVHHFGLECAHDVR